MKHPNFYTRLTPRIKRKIFLACVSIFFVGAMLGFFVGYAAEDKPTELVSTCPVPLTKPTTDTTLDLPIPDSYYYECPLSDNLQDYIRELCEEHDVPMSLVIAVIYTESSFRADVISATNDYGLMQISIVNHEWLSKEYGITDFLDPYQNVFCGITILSQHYNRFCDVDKALMAYNLGATGAKRLWDKGIYETPYTRKVKSAMEVYGNEI